MKQPCNRRTALARSLSAGLGLGLGLSALGLTGCQTTTQATRRNPRSRVGQPIPSATVPEPLPAPPPRITTVRGPTLVPRSQWAKGGPRTHLAVSMGRVSRITVHHDGMSPFYSTDPRDARSRIESIRNAHLSNGWADIGYHYVIDPAGRVYEARSTRLQGAHVKYHNENNLGVMVLGNYQHQRPTPAAQKSLDALIASRMTYYSIPASRVHTHQELRPTACPGQSLQQYMDHTRGRSGVLARV